VRGPSHVLFLFLLLAACAPSPLRLPSGPSVPEADPSAMLHEAIARCEGLRSITAEIGLSGRVGRVKLRGRLQAGFASPQALRVEAVAPFGAPVFILAGTGGRATLWLPRDDRVLADADPSGILDALAGLDVPPDQLRAWLWGCPVPGFQAGAARRYGADWVQVELGGGDALWLRHTDRWRLVEDRAGALAVEFGDFAGVAPGRVRIRRAADLAPALDVRLALSQVETNVTLTDAAFAVDVPASAQPITLDELRASGPLRAANGEEP
jgi:outer membrane biogenesis lipoprotein LolB